MDSAVLFDPAVEVVERFSGHSGCVVCLCRRGNVYFVRKSSSSPAYNPRLSAQIEKQQKAASFMRTPSILSTGLRNGLIYCDMEFITSHDFLAFVTVNQISSLPQLVERILDLIDQLAVRSRGILDPERFTSKLAQIGPLLRRHSSYARHARIVDAALEALDRACWQGIPWTECHGDFTLENILIDAQGNITLIDLLDGELESVWLDIAKLLHDLEIGWSFRNRLWKRAPTAEDRLLALLGRYLREELLNATGTRYPDIRNRLPQLQTLQALRVLPYTTDEVTFGRIVSATGNYLDRMPT